MKVLLQPWPADEMIACPVSKYANSPANNDAQCIAPAT
jgi:putative SOS response-associated peptidase YedK